MSLTVEELEERFIPVSEFDPKNPKPGIYKGLSNEAYHSASHYSSTSLKLAKISIDKFNAPQKKYTKALDLGSATHTLILEPETFKDRVKRKPHGISLNSNDGKDEYIEFLEGFVKHDIDPGKDFKLIKRADFYKKLEVLASDQGFHVLSNDDMDILEGIYVRASCQRDNRFFGAFGHGYNELSAFVIDEETGLPIKARWDHISIVNRCIIDAKSTRVDIVDSQLRKEIGNWGYDFSASLYIRVARQLGFPIDEYVFAFVQTTAPNSVILKKLGPATLKSGDHQVGKVLWKIKHHLDHPNEPTGPASEWLGDIEKPYWEFSNQEQTQFKGQI